MFLCMDFFVFLEELAFRVVNMVKQLGEDVTFVWRLYVNNEPDFILIEVMWNVGLIKCILFRFG